MLLQKENIIDKNIPIPLYFQLKELIISEIKNGSYPSNSMIPTEIEICNYFQISRTTARQAITELVQEHYLYRVKSKGTFVSPSVIKQHFTQKLENFNQEITNLGMVPSTELLDKKIIPATKLVADKLKIAVNEQVIFLYRKRYADKTPIVLVETYLPYTPCCFILEHDLSQESLYDIMSLKDETKIICSNRIIAAVEANSTDAAFLNIKKGKAIQFFESIGYNALQVPLEYSIARYRGDYNQFEVTVFADTP